jgi:hypothetical protein
MFYLSALMACTPQEKSLPIEFDEDFLNQQITLKAPGFANTFSSGEDIYIEITNNSSTDVVFPNDYNIRIFSFSDNKWGEISEVSTMRLPEGNLTLSPNNNSLTIHNTFVAPNLLDLNRQYKLRIYVFGNIDTTQVSAFTDVVLHPWYTSNGNILSKTALS